MTGYMAEMRKIVGRRTIIQCAASVLCVDGRGRVLLGRRSDNHLWGYAGGAAEIDERAEDCARRELQEEMGLTAEELTFFCVNSGPEAHYVYPNGDEVSNFEIVFLCRRWRGEPRALDGEMEALRFFAPQEIRLSQISPPIRPVMEAFLRRPRESAPPPERLQVRCFGYFEVFYQGVPVPFGRTKSKELFAFLVDRRGSACTAEEAIASLYEDTGPEEMKKAKQSLRNLVHDLKETLGRLGQGEALIRRGGALAIRPELLDCDYYRLLKDDLPSAHRFRGEYMEQFSWAERTKAALTFGQQR